MTNCVYPLPFSTFGNFSTLFFSILIYIFVAGLIFFSEKFITFEFQNEFLMKVYQMDCKYYVGITISFGDDLNAGFVAHFL